MKARMVRILVYEGSVEWINRCLMQRGVKGSQTLGTGCVIREALLGDYIEMLPEVPVEEEDR